MGVIDRQLAIDAIDRERKTKHLFNTAEDGLLEARRVINTLPDAETERKMGKWILSDIQNKEDNDNGNYAYICSNCFCHDIHAKTAVVPYCWFCGAKMERGEKNEHID